MSENTSIEVNAADPSIEVEGFVVVGPSPTGDHNHDHGTLTGLADPDHPTSAVIGLDAALAGKEAAGTAASLDAAHVAAADPHTGYQKESEKAAANGYASLDATTKVPFAQLPTGTSASQVAIGNHAHTAVTPGHSIEDETTALTQRAVLRFTGAGVTAVDIGGRTVVDIPGGGGGGVTDHGALTGLSDPDHPIAAVSGLQTALDGKASTTHAHTLDSLTDVDTATVPPTSGQALVWDGTQWEPGTVSGGGGGALNDLTDVDTVTVAPVAGNVLVKTGTDFTPQAHPLHGPPSNTEGGGGNGITPLVVGWGESILTVANEQNVFGSAVRIFENLNVNGVSFRVTTGVAGACQVGIYRIPPEGDPTLDNGWTLFHTTVTPADVSAAGTKVISGTGFSSAAGNKITLTPGWYCTAIWPTTNITGLGLAAGNPLPLIGHRRQSAGAYPQSASGWKRVFGGFGEPLPTSPGLAQSANSPGLVPYWGLYRVV